MTTRGEQTRQHLLDVAERLFGDRGFHAVSLREIRIEAGARNTAAMQFHFGDRDGLVTALMDRHMPRIGAIQQDLYDRMLAEHRTDDTRSLVEVLVRPSAEYLTRGPSERSWVKTMAELSTLPDLRADEMRSAAPEPGILVGGLLYERLCEDLPRLIASRRMIVLAQSAVQMCAARARLVDDEGGRRIGLPMPVFVENLTDMIHGALIAPLSPATVDALERAETPDPTVDAEVTSSR